MDRMNWHRLFGLVLTDFFSGSPFVVELEKDLSLKSICSRNPQDLANSADWKPLQDGVSQFRRGSDMIRVIVLRQLPEAEQNAVLHLVSASAEKVRYGMNHYQQHSTETSTLLDRLVQRYQQEGLAMPYTMEDFLRDDLLERLRKMTPEQRREYVQVVPVKERLEGISPEELEKCLQQRKREAAAPKRKKKK